MRGVVCWLAMAVLAAAMLPGPGAAVRAQDGGTWAGEYFSNPTLSGAPTLVRADAAINFTWGDQAPDASLPADGFSVRWTSTQTFDAGTTRFTVRSDDGIRVYLDNALIVDSWRDQVADPPIIRDVPVTAGQHVLRVEYYEGVGAASVSVTWGAVPAAPTASGAVTWQAEYYNNTALAAPAAAQRSEAAALDYNWGYASPLPGIVNADNFSVRWSATPTFAAGTYTFTVNADDGVRLWVDDTLLVDEWRGSGFTPAYTATMPLSEGAHSVRVEYFEAREVAGIRVQWAATSTAAPATSAGTSAGTWQALYYNSIVPAGQPAFAWTINADGLSLNWGTGSPAEAITPDNFSGRLTRTETFNSGTVRFYVRVDDGFRLYIDGQPVLDQWRATGGESFFYDQTMTPGSSHTLVLDFYESEGEAFVELDWAYTRPALAADGSVTARIAIDTLNVRNGPGEDYPIIGRARDKQVFAVTGRGGAGQQWLRINYGALQGWIFGGFAELRGDATTLPLVSAATSAVSPEWGVPTGLRARATLNLNIRVGPGAEFGVAGLLAENQAADIVGRNGDGTWWEINFTEGRGWISARYVTLEGQASVNSVPVTWP